MRWTAKDLREALEGLSPDAEVWVAVDNGDVRYHPIIGAEVLLQQGADVIRLDLDDNDCIERE